MANWISVKDRLPEKEGSYIVYSSNLEGVITAEFYNMDPEYNPNNPYCVELKHIYRGAGFYDHGTDGTFDEYEPDDITHWMPLPESPSKVKTNIFDQEEIYPNCTVQILKNSVTGEMSIGWWRNGGF